MRPAFLLSLLLPLPLLAAASPAQNASPEIRREASKPQAVGVVHTLRTIPEACARIEGLFTGSAAQPYKFSVVRTSPTCQARARFVDAAKAKPAQSGGWKLNDRIRVPNAGCASQQAVVDIWRKTVGVAPPQLDAQGRSRIYLKDATARAKAQGTPNLPVYAAVMAVEGKACGG
jgi:hypothetical protein